MSPENVKTNILKQIYNDESKKCESFILDLLIPYRFIIREKVEYIYKLFNAHHINLNNIYNGITYEDKENLFYEGKIFTKIQ